MEMDELKAVWNNIPTAENEGNNKLPYSGAQWKIRYRHPLRRILVSEAAGAMVCLLGMIYIAVHLSQWATFMGKMLAISTLILLAVLSAIGLFSAWLWKQEPDYTQSYAQSLQFFAERKKRFARWQQINAIAANLLLVLIFLLLMLQAPGKPLQKEPLFWTIAFSAGYIFLLFFSQWVVRYYRRQIREAEQLLQELSWS